MRRPRRRGSRLQHRIFLWFGASILTSGLLVGVGLWTFGPEQKGWAHRFEQVSTWIGGRFARVWDDPVAREQLARSIATDLDVQVTLFDEQGAVLDHQGGAQTASRRGRVSPCDGGRLRSTVFRAGVAVGKVQICQAHPPRGPWFLVAGLAMGALVLWGAAGALARRLTKPLEAVVLVAQDLGEGRTESRVPLPRRPTSEVQALARAINEMADRIEQQLADQKELLAAVSHEIRTPLGHMRILLELARDRQAAGETLQEGKLNELEDEVLTVERLTAKLLAHSRLEFGALESLPLEGTDLAARALARAGLEARLLHSEENTQLRGDPTLLASALANLLENASKHGGGATALRVSSSASAVQFRVEDAGPGLTPDEQATVFESFTRGTKAPGDPSVPSLGLGLALVQRIARVHGGRAYIDAQEGSGAHVVLEVPRQPPNR